MNRVSRIVVITLIGAVPLLAGANCSGSAVAQAAATTFFNALANNVADVLTAPIGG